MNHTGARRKVQPRIDKGEEGETTGRDDRIRTCDPHTPSVMRYQAALRPETSGGRAYRAAFRALQAPSAG